MLSCYSVWLSRGRTFKRPYDAFPAHERPTKGKGRGKECHTQESSMSSVRMAGLQAASRHGACVVLLFVDVRSSKSDFKFDLKAAPSTLKLSSVSYREVVNQNLALPYRSPASTCDTRIGIRHPHCCSAFLVLASLCRFPQQTASDSCFEPSHSLCSDARASAQASYISRKQFVKHSCNPKKHVPGLTWQPRRFWQLMLSALMRPMQRRRPVDVEALCLSLCVGAEMMEHCPLQKAPLRHVLIRDLAKAGSQLHKSRKQRDFAQRQSRLAKHGSQVAAAMKQPLATKDFASLPSVPTLEKSFSYRSVF